MIKGQRGHGWQATAAVLYSLFLFHVPLPQLVSRVSTMPRVVQILLCTVWIIFQQPTPRSELCCTYVTSALSYSNDFLYSSHSAGTVLFHFSCGTCGRDNLESVIGMFTVFGVEGSHAGDVFLQRCVTVSSSRQSPHCTFVHIGFATMLLI